MLLGAPTSALSLSLSQAHLTPAAFRQALGRFATWDAAHGVELQDLAAGDAGDADMGGDPIAARGRLEKRCAELLGDGAVVTLCGGDNSITYAGVRAVAAAQGVSLDSGRVGLLTLDAHHDMREPDPGPSNGSPVMELLRDGLPGACICQVGISAFANQRELTERARQAGVAVYAVDEVRSEGIEWAMDSALARLAGCDHVYVDVDLDVLDRAFAPACPASIPGGLTPVDLLAAAHRAGADPRVRALDLVEVDSAADVAGITVKTAALAFLNFASGLARRPA